MGDNHGDGDGPVNAPSLFDAVEVEPDNGRARATDPQTSADAGRGVRAAEQRRFIARLLLTRDYLTADDVWAADLRADDDKPDRSAYSSRLGGLVADGLMVKGDPVRRTRKHRERMVVTYHLTSAGRAWVRELNRERGAA